MATITMPRKPRVAWTEQDLLSLLHQQLDAHGGVLYQELGFALAGPPAEPGPHGGAVRNLIQRGAASQGKDRTVSGVASVESISRTGHMFKLEGMDLTQFKRNPVALAQHTAVAFATLHPAAIASIDRVHVEGKKLHFTGMTFDTDPLAEAWYQKIVKRFVRMVSIGSIVHAYQYIEKEAKDGRRTGYIEIVESELLEISPVVIGANRGAFIDPGTIRRSEETESIEALMREVQRLRDVVECVQTNSTKMPTDDAEKKTSTAPTNPLPQHAPDAMNPSDGESVTGFTDDEAIEPTESLLSLARQFKPAAAGT